MPSNPELLSDDPRAGGGQLLSSDPSAGVASDEPRANAEESSKGSLLLQGAAQILPAAATAARTFVDSKAVPYIAAKAGRILGGAAPVVSGAVAGYEVGGLPGGVLGALGGVPAISKGAWAGGKTGWFTGKQLQTLGRPVTGALEKAAPYAQALSTISGAQGVLDLAQMAEPNRKDIGFLGIGASVTPDVAMLTAAVKKGANPTQAAAQLTNGDPRKFAELITAYSKSLGQGQ